MILLELQRGQKVYEYKDISAYDIYLYNRFVLKYIKKGRIEHGKTVQEGRD